MAQQVVDARSNDYLVERKDREMGRTGVICYTTSMTLCAPSKKRRKTERGIQWAPSKDDSLVLRLREKESQQDGSKGAIQPELPRPLCPLLPVRASAPVVEASTVVSRKVVAVHWHAKGLACVSAVDPQGQGKTRAGVVVEGATQSVCLCNGRRRAPVLWWPCAEIVHVALVVQVVAVVATQRCVHFLQQRRASRRDVLARLERIFRARGGDLAVESWKREAKGQ